MSDAKKELKIKVLGHNIKVELDSPGDWSEYGLGRANLLTQTIKLNEALKDDARNVTLLHEIIHLVSDMNAMELTESQVSTLATSLYTIVNENTDLITFKLKKK